MNINNHVRTESYTQARGSWVILRLHVLPDCALKHRLVIVATIF